MTEESAAPEGLTGNIVFNFPIIEGATIYHIFAGEQGERKVTRTVKRRFWFGSRTITVTVPPRPAVLCWTVDGVENTVVDHGALEVRALVPTEPETADSPE